MSSNKKKFNILLGCTGSVATIKLPVIIQTLLEKQSSENLQFDIKIILTENAKHFVQVDGISIPSEAQILTDTDEWNAWKKRGDPVLHIDLTKWADVFVIAPLDANSLAKIAQGLCNNLLLCTARAWNFNKPIFFCPAMNTFMWDHPITGEHIAKLLQWGYREIPCITKTLMCGDTGNGAMADVETIVNQILLSIAKVYQQMQTMGMLDCDEFGHLIARELGGSQNVLNIVPMARHTNRHISSGGDSVEPNQLVNPNSLQCKANMQDMRYPLSVWRSNEQFIRNFLNDDRHNFVDYTVAVTYNDVILRSQSANDLHAIDIQNGDLRPTHFLQPFTLHYANGTVVTYNPVVSLNDNDFQCSNTEQ